MPAGRALSGKRAGVFSDPDILSKPPTIFSTDLAFLVFLYFIKTKCKYLKKKKKVNIYKSHISPRDQTLIIIILVNIYESLLWARDYANASF